jgi:hypothetical protein
MNNMKKWGRSASYVAAAAGLLVLLLVLMQPVADKPVVATGSAAGQLPEPAAGDGVAQAGAGTSAQALMPEGPWFDPQLGASAEVVSPLSTMSPPQFAADGRGKLVLNSGTHANLEKLLLQENPDAMRSTLEQAARNLPPQAAADLKVLVGQFQQYSKALSHSISPENAPQTEQDGLKLLDSLHTLRVSYLGEEATEAMFGADEATTRQLLAVMGADKDPNRTQEQKAERAQEIISQRRPPATTN